MDLNPQNFFLERLGKGTDCRVIRLIKESNTIGRAENNDYILQSSYISRNHAEIKIKDSRIFLKDVNSANGTFINEFRLKNGEQEIKTGDVIGMGCHTSAFSADENLLPTDSIYFYKICVPDCISIDSDTDSDATDINELCDYLANNPGVGFNTSPVRPTNDAIICLSSDEEVELDQIWVERVSGRSNSPVPLSMNTASTSKEQLPMVILPPSARKSIEEAYRKELLATNEVITESTNDTTVDKSGKEFTNCFVRINNLSQDEIKKLKKIDNTSKVEKSPPNRKKENILKMQEELRKLCDEDVSDDLNVELDKTAKRRKTNKHDKTPLECEMKTPTTMTIRRKSLDSRPKVSESDQNDDVTENSPSGSIAKKRKVMLRRHSVHESKSDVVKEKKARIEKVEKVNLPTRIVPKRRASIAMSYNIDILFEEHKAKQFKPERAIQIEALPNKQLRQRSIYKENIIQPVPVDKVKINTADERKKERNEKIRQVAEKQSNRMSVDERVAQQNEQSTSYRTKSVTKPVAKMTMKNRGSFLTEDIAERIKKYKPAPSKPISKTTIHTNGPQNSNINDIKITIEQFRNSHLHPDRLSTEGVCNNVQFYQNINIPNSENNKIRQRKLTITLDDEELEHQRQLQKSTSAAFYEQIPISPPTYSPSVAPSNPIIKTVFNSSPIPSTSSRISKETFQTPVNQKTQLKSILTPTSKSVKSNKRVSFSETLFSVREIPKINQADSEDEESKEFYVVPTETVEPIVPIEPIEPIEPIDKILTEVLSWSPSLLDTKKGEVDHPKNWNFTPMLQSYESLQQYKNILGSILNMELLCNIRGKYSTILNSNKTKWTSFKKIFSAKLSSSLFCIQVTGEIKDNRKNYTIGSLIIVRLTIKHKETKFFGYISEPIDRNNTLKIQCFVNDVNFSLVLTENKVDIFPIMYLRSELKSLMALHQLTETDIMKKVLKPELNQDVAIVEPSRDGILSLNNSQTEICCRIVEDLVNNKDAKVIALQGGPGTGKTKVIAASVMKIIKYTNNCKILICSKSNACINEITILLNSLFFENKINLVRFGNRDRISDAVNKVSLNELANQYMKPPNGCNFHQAKNAVIQRAEVVCTTLNSSYDLINEYRKHFDVCFIDEASQFTDADLIIPVQCGFRKLVLIGDSKQLQPNVNAKELKDLNFEISLLERMNNIANSSSNRNPVLTLKIQHRMNPEIFKFPNQHFYDNQITTSFLHSPSIAVKPYFVFGLKYDQNMTQDTSSYNTGEIKFCYHLCDSLLTIIPPNLSVAIITPYLRQRDELIKYFSFSRDGGRTNDRKNRVEVYTIDSAQGLESDIVILSVTKTRGVGFLANPQRLNVALTRAKKALYVCGNFNSLRNESVWKALLDDAKHRKCYRDIETDAPSSQIITSIKRNNH